MVKDSEVRVTLGLVTRPRHTWHNHDNHDTHVSIVQPDDIVTALFIKFLEQ